MSYKITGKITEVLAIQKGVSKTTGKEWAYQEFVVAPDDNNPQYPKVLCFQISGIEHINNASLKVGANVSLSFDISSRGYNGKYFTTLSAFGVKCEQIEEQNKTNVQQAVHTPKQETTADNLPF